MDSPAAPPDDALEERIRLLIIALGLAINLALVYYSIKDTAPMIELRGRLRMLGKRLAHPWQQAKALRKAESETVWEAIQTVEGT